MHYRKLISTLRDYEIEYYTYEDKQNRPIKVMSRGTYPTCSIKLITEDMLDNVTTMKPLPLHMLSFNKPEDIKEIFAILFLCLFSTIFVPNYPDSSYDIALLMVDWTTESVKILINSYEMHACLYDTKHKYYSNKHARADALIKITNDIKPNMRELTIEDVKKKLNNLQSQFAHENNKVIASRKSGIGTDDIYEFTIWWYEELLFLLPYVKVRKGKSNFDESSQ
ncbi:hypothetical protein FQA39_LY02334 [Lamprigera yunnana]|nr:hypothetical protein FQA39_LY02334 [Lamprigera yunnana]